MREIKLTRGQVALVDDDDFERINKHKWCACKSTSNRGFYARRLTYGGKRQSIQMHHEVFGSVPDGLVVDHIDRDSLNNQKSNLRLASIKENSSNRTAYGASKYLGVCRSFRNGKVSWRAFINISDRQVYLGSFKTEVEAAIAYNQAAKIERGEFANLNVIEPFVLMAELDKEVNAIIISGVD